MWHTCKRGLLCHNVFLKIKVQFATLLNECLDTLWYRKPKLTTDSDVWFILRYSTFFINATSCLEIFSLLIFNAATLGMILNQRQTNKKHKILISAVIKKESKGVINGLLQCVYSLFTWETASSLNKNYGLYLTNAGAKNISNIKMITTDGITCESKRHLKASKNSEQFLSPPPKKRFTIITRKVSFHSEHVPLKYLIWPQEELRRFSSINKQCLSWNNLK